MEKQLVKLVHATPNAENLVSYMARVSAPKNQENFDTAPKLIKYLMKHSHWSPFEMVNMCVEINTTRDIAAQILRHRSFSFQEFSQRYADVRELGSLEVPQLRRQDTKNRQNSIPDLDKGLEFQLKTQVTELFNRAQDLYSSMLNYGVAKESARKILPMNSPSRIYMNGTLRSWIHYIDLRSANGTQLEHQQIAIECGKVFAEQFPSINEAYLDWKKDEEKAKNALDAIVELEAQIATLNAQIKELKG